MNFQLEKLNFEGTDQRQNLISSSLVHTLITIKISSRLVNSSTSYRVRKKFTKNELKAPKLSFPCTELHQKLISTSPTRTTSTVKISYRSVQFNGRNRVRKKNWVNKQTKQDTLCQNSGLPFFIQTRLSLLRM